MSRDQDQPRSDEEIARLLEQMAAEEQATLDLAKQLTHVPGLDRVDEILSAEMARTGPVRSLRNRLRGPMMLLAAAALMVLAVVLIRDREEPVGPGTIELSGEKLEILRPRGEVEKYGTIEWSYSSTEQGLRYRLRVLAPGLEEDRVLLEKSLRDTFYIPEDASKWPDRIAIEIDVNDATGQSLDTLRVLVSRCSGRTRGEGSRSGCP